jgi:chromosome segregation ATPase
MGEQSKNRRDLVASIEREVALLEQARDELKLQLGLAKAEASAEWKRLESSYKRLEDELGRARSELSGPIRELGGAARGLVDELGRGYARFKEALKRN